MKNRKVGHSNGPIPGCLGRMVNLFDTNPGVAGNKRLMDKPHYDGSSRSRSRSVVPSLNSPIADPFEDKLVISEARKNAPDRTPMKMLIDHEMSKEDEPMPNTPSLVAKLMGLDTLPRQNYDSVLHCSQSNTHGTNSKMHLEKPRGNKHTDTSISKKQWKCEADYVNQKDYNDMYEIWKQAQGEKLVRDVSPQKGRHVKDIDERKMALVRQRFSEAKRLVTDDKLRQTGAFQEALEFLNSNRDLFLKCLQEPNSQRSQQLYGKYTIPETQRITVLKPSKIVEDIKSSESENKNQKHARKPVPVAVAHGRSKSNDECSSTFSHWDADHFAPTRIVVLKPSFVNAPGIGTMGSPNSSSLITANCNNFFNDSEVSDTNESREVAKEITRLMRDKLMGRQGDDTLLSSVFSNGYTGDESSVSKSDNEYDGESVSEAMSPTSRHSWDYINRFSSPFSSSSFSRASCSPESSVCREAKKRLSERWAMAALHGNPTEHRHVRRNTCTLGEMLALSDTRKPHISEDVGCKETSGSVPYMSRNSNTDVLLPEHSHSLIRSKSVPVSSSVYGDRLNVQLSGPEVGELEESREAKSKSTKMSFKGKISSLFFSKNKKVKKAEPNVPELENLPHVNTLIKAEAELFIGKNNFETSKLPSKKISDECIHIGDQGKIGDMASSEDQPSPISVLEMPFGEIATCAMELASCSRQEQGRAVDDHLKSCLIDKSPPIGSISRKDQYSDIGSTYLITPSVAPLQSETEDDWLHFVQTMLADSGISDEVQSDALSTRWHSTDSPLDPSLKEKYMNLNNKAIASGANLRQWRSRCKLMYDCVNAALVDITCNGTSEPNHKLQHPNGSSSKGHSQISLTDDVWTRIKEWINYDARSVVGVGGDSPNRLLVESVVKNEVVGKRWVENIRVETDEVGKEIEEMLLEELMEDAVCCCIDR